MLHRCGNLPIHMLMQW